MSRTLVICCTDAATGEMLSIMRENDCEVIIDQLLVGDTLIQIESTIKKWRATSHRRRQIEIDFHTGIIGELEVSAEEFKQAAEEEGWHFLNREELEREFPEFMKALASDIE